jgi:hypothetical protein
VARFVGRADHVGGTPLPRGTSSGHECFLAVKPNQPEDDGEYGVPDVALPNVALPISHRQLPACHIKSPQSARPLIRGHEREANGTKQDKCRDHSRLSSPARRLCPNPVHTTTAEKFKLRHYRIWARSSACTTKDRADSILRCSQFPHTYKIMRGRGGDSRCSSFDAWTQASLMPILELWPCSIS